jgi:predicted PurR-regulated permease PerM
MLLQTHTNKTNPLTTYTMTDSTTVSHQINSVIDHLADKLHVPAQHVWNALLVQVKIEFWQSFIYTVFIGVVLGVFIYYLVKFAKKYFASNDDGSLFGLSFIFTIISVITSLVFFAAFNSTITRSGALFNPEYYAVSKLTSLLK